jgi:hypothetical protein
MHYLWDAARAAWACNLEVGMIRLNKVSALHCWVMFSLGDKHRAESCAGSGS